MHELSLAAQLTSDRILTKDLKNPKTHLFVVESQLSDSDSLSMAAKYSLAETARFQADRALNETLAPIAAFENPRSGIRNAFLRRTVDFGNIPAFSAGEMRIGAFGLWLELNKAIKKHGFEGARNTYNGVIGLRNDAVQSIAVLHKAIDYKSGNIYEPSARLVRSGEIKDQLITYIMAQAETRKNSRRKPGSPEFAADWRYWEYCLDAVSDKGVIDTWRTVYEGQKGRMKFLGNEITSVEKHRAVRTMGASSQIPLRSTYIRTVN